MSPETRAQQCYKVASPPLDFRRSPASISGLAVSTAAAAVTTLKQEELRDLHHGTRSSSGGGDAVVPVGGVLRRPLRGRGPPSENGQALERGVREGEDGECREGLGGRRKLVSQGGRRGGGEWRRGSG